MVYLQGGSPFNCTLEPLDSTESFYSLVGLRDRPRAAITLTKT